MHKYYCSKCDKVFFKEGANVNMRHFACGEYAKLDWSHDGSSEEQNEGEEEKG